MVTIHTRLEIPLGDGVRLVIVKRQGHANILVTIVEDGAVKRRYVVEVSQEHAMRIARFLLGITGATLRLPGTAKPTKPDDVLDE